MQIQHKQEPSQQREDVKNKHYEKKKYLEFSVGNPVVHGTGQALLPR